METFYEGKARLFGFPLKEKCTLVEPGLSTPTSKESHSNFENAVDGNFLSVELEFFFWLWDCHWTPYVLEEVEDMVLQAH